MTVYLNLETGAGGTPEEALEASRKAAQITRLWVKVNINGVQVLIHPDDGLAALVTNWRKALDRGVSFCSVNIVPAADL